MDRQVLVTLLETTVFAHIVQIVTTNDDGTLHLQLLDDSVQDTSTDANITGEGAFVIDIGAFDSL